jgi:acyl-CoA synthetase (NDP forming)
MSGINPNMSLGRCRGIPEHVNLAVIVAPAKTVPDIVEKCGKAGVGGEQT